VAQKYRGPARPTRCCFTTLRGCKVVYSGTLYRNTARNNTRVSSPAESGTAFSLSLEYYRKNVSIFISSWLLATRMPDSEEVNQEIAWTDKLLEDGHRSHSSLALTFYPDYLANNSSIALYFEIISYDIYSFS
jgi:hypothetical protein